MYQFNGIDTFELLAWLGALIFTYLILSWLAGIATGIYCANRMVNVSRTRAVLTGALVGLTAIPLNIFWLFAGQIILDSDFFVRYIHITRHIPILHMNEHQMHTLAGPLVIAGIVALVTRLLCYGMEETAANFRHGTRRRSDGGEGPG